MSSVETTGLKRLRATDMWGKSKSIEGEIDKQMLTMRDVTLKA